MHNLNYHAFTIQIVVHRLHCAHCNVKNTWKRRATWGGTLGIRVCLLTSYLPSVSYTLPCLYWRWCLLVEVGKPRARPRRAPLRNRTMLKRKWRAAVQLGPVGIELVRNAFVIVELQRLGELYEMPRRHC